MKALSYHFQYWNVTDSSHPTFKAARLAARGDFGTLGSLPGDTIMIRPYPHRVLRYTPKASRRPWRWERTSDEIYPSHDDAIEAMKSLQSIVFTRR